jgi:3-hydroxyisobutyrate dehydrogenase
LSSPTRVSVIGTGTMGAPIARNLVRAGFEVTAWNRSPGRTQTLRDDGVMVADTVADAIDGADFFITMLADADAVTQVLDDGAGLDPAGPDAIWIQMGTIGLDGIDHCRTLADDRDLTFVDAPVLGTREPAEQAQLVVLGSGPDHARERCEPVFAAIASRTIWLGEAGAGSRLKLVANAWIVTLVEGLAETVALAEALDLAPARFLDAIAGGPLDVGYARIKAKAIAEQNFTPSFKLGLAAKDAGLALDAARRREQRLPLLEAIVARFEDGIADGHGDKDAIATYLTTTQPAVAS